MFHLTIPSKAIFILLLFSCAVVSQPHQKQSQTRTHQMQVSRSEQTEAFSIVVKKSERKLYLYRTVEGRKKLVKTYSIALGFAPQGHKQQRGDGATPEGDYYITHKNHQSNFYLSLGLSYPNIRDAKSGLERGLISKSEYKSIVSAINNKAKPPQNTRLGGDIFIHGGGAGFLSGDWTAGCAALDNKDIKELFETVPIKTPVRIEP